YKKSTYLILDECHRWSKAQSDSVLAAIEEGLIILLGTTTENPYAALTPAIVSRCRIFQLQPLSDADVIEGLKRAAADTENGIGSLGVELTPDALTQFAFAASGDMRNALNGLELAALTTPANKNGKIIIDKKIASESMQSKTISVDESLYYDMLSALCKSLRGTDPTASLYWGMRLIESGCDPLVVARRVVAHASEDVGMADSNALLMATAAFDAVRNLGMPEGRLALCHAIIYIAKAPKSNAVVVAMGEAIKDAQSTANNNVPTYLRDRNYKTPDDDGAPYKYPHAYEGNYVEQEYMPKELQGRNYFEKTNNG
ncbi:MAG: replication-associated recombination protein A, partial [Firmicutes bacterium]|nr:replication-associated recombination protein A [Bacillota bacterium]